MGFGGWSRSWWENYATELGFWPDIIATGGDAAKVIRGMGAGACDCAGFDAVWIATGVREHYIKMGRRETNLVMEMTPKGVGGIAVIRLRGKGWILFCLNIFRRAQPTGNASMESCAMQRR